MEKIGQDWSKSLIWGFNAACMYVIYVCVFVSACVCMAMYIQKYILGICSIYLV